VHVTYPNGESERFEPGDLVPAELEDRIDPNNMLSPDAPAEVVEQPVVDYAKLGKEELVQLAIDRGLEPTGSKPELVKRLKSHDGALS
jgi:hypothetical protein